MEINPHLGKCGPMAWWRISPKAIANMLHANGFAVRSMTINKFDRTENGSSRRLKFFTIVAERI